MIDVNYYKYESGSYIQINNVLVGPPIKELVDDTLDTGTLIMHSPLPEIVKKMQSVKVESGSFVKFFLVADIQTEERYIKNSNKYKHIITLIEPTKYLEKVVCSAISDTNRNHTLRQQIERILLNAEPIELGMMPRFSLSENFKNFLGTTKGEDFFFQNSTTLREILDSMLEVKKARCEVYNITDFNNIVIDYYDQSKLGKKITIDKQLKNQNVDNIEYLGTDIEAYGENAFSENREAIWYPSSNYWDTPKTEDAVLTKSNALFRTTFPIEEITDFQVSVTYNIAGTISGGGGGSFNETMNYDGTIMSNVVDNETYAALYNSGSNAVIKTNQLYKENTIFYTRSSNILNAGGSYKANLFFTAENVETAILNSLWNGIVADWQTWNNATVNTIQLVGYNITQLRYRIKYIPYIDAHAKIGKTNYKDVPSTIISNQSDKTIDLGRYGISLFNQINRLGNKEIVVDKNHKSVEELYELLDYTDDNYVLVESEFAFYLHHIKAKYKFTKDFNSISEKIGIDRRKRVYNIPLENFVRDILIKQYMKVSFSPSAPSGGFVDCVAMFIRTFSTSVNLPATSGITRVKTKEPHKWSSTSKTNYSISVNAGFETPNINHLDGYNPNNYPLGTIAVVYNNELATAYFEVLPEPEYFTYELPVAPYAMANSVLFKFKFYDNYSAGISTYGTVIGGIKQEQNPYVDENGEYLDIRLRLYNDESATRNNSYAQYFPLINDWYSSQTAIFDTEYQITKDAYEHHHFTLQLEIASTTDDIVIGHAFAKRCSLITKTKTTFKLWASAEKYTSLSTINIKNGSTQITSFTITTLSNGITVNFTENSSWNSWALTDHDNKLILAVNRVGGVLNKTVYFTPSKTYN